MKLNLSVIDIIVIISYFLLIIYIGFIISHRKSGKNQTKEDFLLAGRKLTTPFFVATLVATWYGNILGVGEFVFNSGIVAWLCFGVAYYIAAIYYALYLAKKIRNSGFYSIPDQIGHFYGETAGWLSAVIVLIISIPAAYILMLGIMLQLFTGWSLVVCVIAGSLISIAYLYTGGFRADVLTNSAQFIFMYLGFFIILIFAVMKFGIVDFSKMLPANHLKIFGGFSWQYILSWFFIALQTIVDPSFHQRSAAADKPETAKKGILISVGFWFLFDMLTLFTGLYARAFMPKISAVMSYPALAEYILPSFFKGLFVIALLSSIMSALDGYTFVSAFTIGNNILSKTILKNRKITDKKLTQIGLIFTSILGITLALILPSPVELIFKTASIAVPGLIIPLIVSFTTKWEMKPKSALIIMLASSSTAAIWMLLQKFNLESTNSIYYFINNSEPMLAGIVVSVILSLILIKKKKQ